jgi:hypothetical protein
MIASPLAIAISICMVQVTVSDLPYFHLSPCAFCAAELTHRFRDGFVKPLASIRHLAASIHYRKKPPLPQVTNKKSSIKLNPKTKPRLRIPTRLFHETGPPHQEKVETSIPCCSACPGWTQSFRGNPVQPMARC